MTKTPKLTEVFASSLDEGPPPDENDGASACVCGHDKYYHKNKFFSNTAAAFNNNEGACGHGCGCKKFTSKGVLPRATARFK